MTKELPESCLNCGKAISEEMVYCPNCGQRNRKSKLPLGTFLSDFFEDYFTVDARFFRSLGKLVYSPGALTREFNSGKRKTYIAPFRLYIFISFLFFFVLAINHRYDDDFRKESFITFGDSTIVSDSEIMADTLLSEELSSSPDSVFIGESEKGVDINFGSDSEDTSLEDFLEERAKRANENPELFVQTMFKAASVTMFIMLPFFGLLLYFFHFRKHKFYVEHLVHSIHFHSFLFVILLFALIANWAFDWSGYSWIFLVAFVYLLLSLKTSYRQSYLKSIFKALLLLPIYICFIGLAMILVVVGAVIMT